MLGSFWVFAKKMTSRRWDGYGNWDSIANIPNIEEIKKKITGSNSWACNVLPPEALSKFPGVGATLDFGCGLGRNAELLRPMSPEGVIGVDIPSMIKRIQSLDKSPYIAITEDLDAALKLPHATTFFESVVFQHIEDHSEIKMIIDKILKSNVRVIFSLWNATLTQKIKWFCNLLLTDWDIVLRMKDEKTFDIPHVLLVFNKKKEI